MSTESGSLNESLKALRVLHQLLMVAAFGVLVLGLTPDQTRHYNSALDELQALRTIRQPMDQEYGAYLGKQVSASEDDKELLLTMARATGANVPKDIEISQPFTSDFAFVGSYFMDLDSFFGRVHKITRFK